MVLQRFSLRFSYGFRALTMPFVRSDAQGHDTSPFSVGHILHANDTDAETSNLTRKKHTSPPRRASRNGRTAIRMICRKGLRGNNSASYHHLCSWPYAQGIVQTDTEASTWREKNFASQALTQELKQRPAQAKKEATPPPSPRSSMLL